MALPYWNAVDIQLSWVTQAGGKDAVYGNLVPETDTGKVRIRFVMEGEASLHACMLSGLATIYFQWGSFDLNFDLKFNYCFPRTRQRVSTGISESLHEEPGRHTKIIQRFISITRHCDRCWPYFQRRTLAAVALNSSRRFFFFSIWCLASVLDSSTHSTSSR